MEYDVEVEQMCAEGKMPKEMRWRIGFSIFTVFAGMAFVIAWLFFFAGDYSIWENLGVFILSFLVFIGVNVAVWVPWGLRHAPMEERHKMGGPRSWASALIGIAACAFLIFWLLLYADGYSIYQNLAMLLIVVMVGGGLNAAIWAGKNKCC